MKIKKDIAVSETGLVFNPTTGESYSLNPIGMEIFSLMKEGKSTEEISGELLEHYHTDSSTLDKDIHDFMEMLNHYLLLEKDEEE